MKTLHLTNHWHAESGGISTFYRQLLEYAEEAGRPIRLVVPDAQDGVEDRGRQLARPATFASVPAGTWLERAGLYPAASPVVPLCAARVTRIAAEVALAPSPHARLAHVGAEVAAQFIGQRARVTQLGVEAAICPDTTHLRVTYIGREVMMRPMPVAGRRVLQVRPLFDASRIINRKGL